MLDRLPSLIIAASLLAFFSAASAAPGSETVITTSGQGFPWGLFGFLGLMGLARGRRPGRVIVVAPPAPDDMEAAEQMPEVWTSTETAPDTWAEQEEDEGPHDDDTATHRDAADMQSVSRAAEPPPEPWDWDKPAKQSQPLPDDPDAVRPSERFARRAPGAPDLSRPPGRR
ncbi:hypothetical protein [Deinococcus radiophilus]|uniref:Uncharacterized protein n=1 Tax=Deinococcus radiophilus TaxID=32062 RepID=A0A431W646_9DEIO|nr:hypothetical protein [Deinococcus radiophilus]RTR30850.1 hypothetical protein EJ104_00950 [Deinococcus radiophilus]